MGGSPVTGEPPCQWSSVTGRIATRLHCEFPAHDSSVKHPATALEISCLKYMVLGQLKLPKINKNGGTQCQFQSVRQTMEELGAFAFLLLFLNFPLHFTLSTTTRPFACLLQMTLHFPSILLLILIHCSLGKCLWRLKPQQRSSPRWSLSEAALPSSRRGASPTLCVT